MKRKKHLRYFAVFIIIVLIISFVFIFFNKENKNHKKVIVDNNSNETIINENLKCVIVDNNETSLSVLISTDEIDFLKQNPGLKTSYLKIVGDGDVDLSRFEANDVVSVNFNGEIIETSPASIVANEIRLLSSD